MAEEIERLKSDLKHTSSARTRAEHREDEARSNLTTAEGELREVRGELQVAQSDLVETREGLQSAQSELQLVREELITSRGEQRDLQAELRVVTGGLNETEKQLEIARREVLEGKVLLETARHESSEAVNLSGRLSEECRGLRTELHQRDSMVAQRDEVIRQLRDQAGAQWAYGWLAFQRKAIHAYSNLDFNFDLPSDEEAEESSGSRKPGTPCHAPIPGPTRLADPNRFPRRETQDWDSLPDFFFFKQNWYLWVWPTSYNIIKISYTFIESHLQIQN